jgi:hypothetical protein
LTAAYYACNDRKKSIILSKPDALVYIEDVVMNHTLGEMRAMFYEGVEYIKQQLKGEDVYYIYISIYIYIYS